VADDVDKRVADRDDVVILHVGSLGLRSGL
jgi:hypothetical protein